MAKSTKEQDGKYDTLETVAPVQHKKKTSLKGGNITSELADEVADLPANVKVRHPNRNPDKKETRSAKKTSSDAKESGTARSSKQTQSIESQANEISRMGSEELKMLSSVTSPICISIYLPTHSSGAEVNGKTDVTAFRNSIQRVAAELRAKKTTEEYVERLLEPVHQLAKSSTFWNEQSQGLAVFIGDHFFRYYKMPSAPQDSVTVNSAFMIQPLVNVVSSPEYFYILSVSKKQARFYKADAFGIEYISVPELPNGIEDVVHLENKDDQKLFRTGSSGAGGGASYHGMGAGKPDDKENIRMYLDEVDETLWQEILHNENKPLVLAGVEYLLPLFRDVTQYAHVWPDSLTGNFESEDLKTLHQRALEVVKPFFDTRKMKALENFGIKSATALTSSEAKEIIPAAYYGKIDTLFVSKAASLWGTFDKQSNKLKMHESREEADESLIDGAILQTLLNGGQVYELDAEKMPSKDSSMAALFRY